MSPSTILDDLAEYESRTVAEVLLDGRLILPSGEIGPCAQVVHQHGTMPSGELAVWTETWVEAARRRQNTAPNTV